MYYFQTKKKFAFVLCSMLSSLGPSHWSMLGFQKILVIFLVSPSYLFAISIAISCHFVIDCLFYLKSFYIYYIISE